MEDWYSALLIPLKDLGWTEHNDDEMSPGEGLVRSCKSLKGGRRKPETNPHQNKAASFHTGQGGFLRDKKVKSERCSVCLIVLAFSFVLFVCMFDFMILYK